MKPDEFNNLTVEQAEQGFKHCAENADRLFKAGETLAKKEDYALGNSLLILASEEATKAIFLYYKYQWNGTLMEVQSLFTKHITRHNFAKEYYHFFHFQLITLMGQIAEHNKIAFTEEYFTELEKTEYAEAQTSRLVIEVFATQYDRLSKFNPDKPSNRKTLVKWFNKANERKERGFYVDHRKPNWITPSVITEEDYRQSHFITWNLVQLTLMLNTTGAKMKSDMDSFALTFVLHKIVNLIPDDEAESSDEDLSKE